MARPRARRLLKARRIHRRETVVEAMSPHPNNRTVAIILASQRIALARRKERVSMESREMVALARSKRISQAKMESKRMSPKP
jgi:hypothetical protein